MKRVKTALIALFLAFLGMFLISSKNIKAEADYSVGENVEIVIYGSDGTNYMISGKTGSYSNSYTVVGPMDLAIIADSGEFCGYYSSCASLSGDHYYSNIGAGSYTVYVVDYSNATSSSIDTYATYDISITVTTSSSSGGSTSTDPDPDTDTDSGTDSSDTTAPEWWTNDVYYIDSGDSIYVELTDDDSGVYGYYDASTYYKYGWSTSSGSYPSTWEDDFDSESFYKVSFTAIAPTVSSDTTYYLWIYYTGQDNDGNVATYSGKTPNSIGNSYAGDLNYEYLIRASDTTAPTITSYTGGSSSWKYSVTLSINGASDAGVGLASTPYCFVYSSSKTDPGYSSCSWKSKSTKTIKTQKNKYCHAYVRDSADNVLYAGYQRVRVDRTAPVITGVTITNSSGGNWTNESVTITLAGATDAHSGFSKYEYSYDNSTWYSDWGGAYEVDDTHGTWTAERENIVYFRVVDKVGNVSNITETTYIKIDKTVPIMRVDSSSGTALTASTSTNSYDGTVRTFYFTDSASGFSYATLKYSHITSTSTTTTSSLTLYPGEKCEVTVYDNAGNSATYNIDFDDNIAADNILATATLSNGQITFTKASSNNIQEMYKNADVTYFIGKYGNYTTTEALNTGFANYGVTVSASTFFASSWTTPQGLVGNVELYVRLSGTNLATIFAKSGSLNIVADTTSTTNFALECDNPVELTTSTPVATLSTSNIITKNNTTNSYYLLFVSMILISSLLAIEVIIIKKHKKAHN